METKEITLHVKFIAECTDGMGYTNYVFEVDELKEIYKKSRA